MEYSTHRITLDVAGQGTQASLSLRRGESGHRLEVCLTEEGIVYDISGDCYAMFVAGKSDGTQIFDTCTIENNVLCYEFGEQVTACPGKTDCEIRLYGENGLLLIAPKFSMFVEDAVLDEERVISSSDYSALTNLIRNVRDNAFNTITEVSATIENDSGTPSVTLEKQEAETGKELIFHFSGLKGEQGPRGEIGPRGEKGETGASGPQGIQGLIGETGEKGAKGDKGDKGDSGVYVGSGTVPEGFNVQIDPNGSAEEFVEEAPNDGKQYARKNKAWTEVTGGGGGGSTSVKVNNVQFDPVDGVVDIGDVVRDDSGKLDKTGGTMTGNLTLNNNLRFSGTAYITAGGETVFKSSGSGTELGNAGRLTTVLGSGTRPKYSDGNTSTDMALYSDLSGKADAPIIAQSLPPGGVLAVNTQYYLGTQSAVTITLPPNAAVGQEILVVFTSGATAATIICELPGFSFAPKANKTSWLKFSCYNSDGDWLVETKEG